MNNKTIKLFSIVILIPAIAGCVRIPAKSKPAEASKKIMVDSTFQSQPLSLRS